MTRNMVTGSPLRLILSFSLPLLAANLFQQFYNMVDAAIVGRTLGAASLGAVGATSSVQFLVLGFCTGSCVGFGIPIAQKFGAGDLKGMRSVIFHSGILAAAIAVVMTAATVMGCNAILHILQVPQDIYRETYQYIIVIFRGIPFTILYNLLASILRSVGDSRTPFLFVMFSSVLNIFLDVFTIVVLHWGVTGAAVATVFSQGLAGVLCLVTILRRFPVLHLDREDMRWDRDTGVKTALMGIPTGLQYSITAVGSMIMQSANNSLGTLYVSAFAAGMKIKQLALCPFDAFASATATFAGQNYGGGRMDRIREGLKDGLAISVLYGIGIGMVLIFTGRLLSAVFVPASQGDVLDASAEYLRCMGYLFWLLAPLSTQRQVVQSLGFPGLAIFSGVVEMIARGIVATVFVPKFGYDAICWTDQTAWATAAVYITIICMVVLRKVSAILGPDSKVFVRTK